MTDKIHTKADPWFLENQILVKRDRKQDYEVFLSGIQKLLSHCKPKECRPYILVVPHACQVDPHYLENMKSLGVKFTQEEAILEAEYPFIVSLKDFLIRAGRDDVHVINPAQVFREHEKLGQPVYYQNDIHLNRYGQSVLGKFVYKEIFTQKNSFVPSGL
jgi:hypothetical protein